MGNGDTKRDTAKIFEANQRTMQQLLDYLLTSEGFTGNFSGRCFLGKIEMLKLEHTHPVDSHGRMGPAARHDPEKL